MDYGLLSEKERVQKLNDGLVMADRIINKNYLINVSEQEVIPLEECYKNTAFVRLFEIEKLIYDKKENVNDKLISVYSAFQNIESSVVLIIRGEKEKASFYIGVRSDRNAPTGSLILQKGFEGNFPGSTLRKMKNGEVSGVLESIIKTDYINAQKNISAVTVVPSMRDEDKEKFVQSIDKLINTMHGNSYTAVLIAEPVSKEKLELKKRGYEELYSSISPFQKTTLAYGDNFSTAVSKGMVENLSESVNNSISNTSGKNIGENDSVTSPEWFVSQKTKGYSSGESWSKAVTEGRTSTYGSSKSSSDTETKGSSRTLTVEHMNKSAEVLLKQLDEQMERINMCEAFGVWEYAAYFVADDIQTSVTAANTYKALMLGDGTAVENSFLNVWNGQISKQTYKVLEYLKYGLHPVIEIKSQNDYDKQAVTPANIISGKELPLLLGMPHKSVPGLMVTSIAEFGRNIFRQNENKDRKSVNIGQIHHMGKTESGIVNLDLNSFTSHCFVTGSTGSGKSNTTYCLLEKFLEENVPFLVIEPAKGEYKEAFGNVDGINIFTTNPSIGQMLKLNPFRFDKNIHVLEHLDRLIEIFNACWEMYAAMPAILKDAVEKIYVQKGWDLLNSVYIGEGEPVYPTFNDLMKTLPKVINSSGYSSDTKGDYTGALVTRVSSLTNGISGQIFCDNYDIPDEVMFDQNTIVDLSRVGSSETKSLIMGILVLKLSEYRMANADGANRELRHITVLEEAHNLLKRTQPGQSGSNVVAKSVEMICNSIAEMRTYGEGFIIVDQSPTAVDIAAIKNTNTKIIMRLPEKGDCEAIGNSVGLNEEQIGELSKLSTGIAVVMQNNWLEAVLAHIDLYSEKYVKQIPTVNYTDIKKLRGAVAKEMIDQYVIKRVMNFDEMLSVIDAVDIDRAKKEEMKLCMRRVYSVLSKQRNMNLFCDTLANISGAKELFKVLEPKIKSSKDGKYNKDNIKKWEDEFKTNINNYVDIPADYNRKLLLYMLFDKEKESEEVNYKEIEKMLFEKIGR